VRIIEITIAKSSLCIPLAHRFCVFFYSRSRSEIYKYIQAIYLLQDRFFSGEIEQLYGSQGFPCLELDERFSDLLLHISF